MPFLGRQGEGTIGKEIAQFCRKNICYCNIMVDIDLEKLQNLMELVIKAYPELDPYVVWI